MVAAFMINAAGRACLAQFAEYTRITALRLVDGNLCCLTLEDGSEEMFTDEIHSQIFDSLRRAAEVLVADVGPEGSAQREYFVPVT